MCKNMYHHHWFSYSFNVMSILKKIDTYPARMTLAIHTQIPSNSKIHTWQLFIQAVSMPKQLCPCSAIASTWSHLDFWIGLWAWSCFQGFWGWTYSCSKLIFHNAREIVSQISIIALCFIILIFACHYVSWTVVLLCISRMNQQDFQRWNIRKESMCFLMRVNCKLIYNKVWTRKCIVSMYRS